MVFREVEVFFSKIPVSVNHSVVISPFSPTIVGVSGGSAFFFFRNSVPNNQCREGGGIVVDFLSESKSMSERGVFL